MASLELNLVDEYSGDDCEVWHAKFKDEDGNEIHDIYFEIELGLELWDLVSEATKILKIDKQF